MRGNTGLRAPARKTLATTPKDNTTDNKQTKKRQTKCQRYVKLKELQADTQANAFAAHLILPNRTRSPPTTLTTGRCDF
jgi:hypothetical protein